jgi:hypothetical protein
MKKQFKDLSFVGLTIALVLGLGGCLPFPLGDPGKSQIDSKLTGYWMRDSNDEAELVAMYPFDEHAYVVQDLKLKKQDDKWQPQGQAQVFKGWLTNVKNARFLTLEPLIQRVPGEASEKKVYPALRVTLNSDQVVTRMVNSDSDLIKEVKSSADLLAVITRELDNPDLYGSESAKFRRLDPERDGETIQLLTNP